MEPSFEIFDHTADAGIRVRAATLPGLIEPATRGLYAVIGELAETGEEESARFEQTGSDATELLRDYLAGILLLFERDHRKASTLETPVFDDGRLAVVYRTRSVDSEKSVYYREVKAVTYHELAIRPIPGGYEATVIVDI